MISVVLCGGAGSRLWPVSRELHPKPFLRLPDGHSLIQKAFIHAASLPHMQEILTVTNRDLHFKAIEEFKNSGVSVPSSYILEPFGRNTAPAIAAAAFEVKRRFGGDTPMLILAADHLISKPDNFSQAVAEAVELAADGKIVALGIQPTGPECGFGYIEAEGRRVLRFVEKPDPGTALEYFESGKFFWNAGIFCFKADTVLSELAIYNSDLAVDMEKCLERSRAGACHDDVVELDGQTFSTVKDISIDYAVMERTDKAAVVPCDIGWSDIGSWTVLCSLNEADLDGNHVFMAEGGASVLQQTQNCDIHGGGRLVAALGLENILIVDTPDALLVADKKNVQEVKSIYNRLKKSGNETYRHHRTVYRPWGSYTLLETGPRFKIKRLEIKPGGAISLQLHHHRSEHWIVVSGMAEVFCNDETRFINTNESIYIRAGHKHRVSNNGLIDLVIIEVQSGDYLGEDDIVRFEDKYGRPVMDKG
ncbi:mannose-1-phosphate guanylyltransferase/mannose-6-phosphate isomerase (plasmid) [Deltaproteobacteria bacterium Smac51]|nr:mannose-1-phosphate guanylyltransferase/mannose-6-phosphate isomerase [Deltaproteobacteria bacterium Smac51]